METINQIELYDIYPLWHIPFWQTTTFYMVVGITTLFVVISLIAWLIIRYKKRKIRIKSPWQQALEQLHALQEKKYTTKAAGKQCYFAMTTIIKQYLHARYGLDTLGKTDDELILYLKENGTLSEQILKNLQEICKGCVFIKFANQEAIQNQIEKHIELCIHVVTKTIPQDRG